MAQGKAAKPVTHMGISTRQIQHQPGCKVLVQQIQRLLQRLQVFIVRTAIGQFHIQVARLLAKRKVARPVQRQREHAGIAAKDMRRAVALVHVQVDDRYAQRLRRASAARTLPFGLHEACGHRNVVEHAKSAAFVGIGVVRAAGQIARQPFSQGHAARRNGGAHRACPALGHRLGPRKTDLSLCRCRQGAGSDRLDVAWRVGQGQFSI